MFSYENIYALLHPKEFVADVNSSLYYDLVSYDVHNENFAEDVLLDVILAVRAGRLNLSINDMICVRSNGKLFCFRYVNPALNASLCRECFAEVEHFFDKEISDYVNELHEKGYVLNVLDGRILSVSDTAFEHKRAFCIEEERFEHGKNFINNTFSVYGLFGLSIKNMDPSGHPFISLNNALYFLRRNKKARPFLLLNRNELEMIKDKCELNSIELAI